MKRSDLVDRIYEAAFVPEFWPQALAEIAALADSSSGAMLIVDQRLPPLYSATDNTIDLLRAFAQTPHWYDNTRLQRMQRKNHSGFLEVGQFSTAEERQRDFSEHNLEAMGASWQVGSAVSLPAGEIALFTFERVAGASNFSDLDIDLLDGLRPHLARASLLAARLGLERAEASAQSMNAVGIPAAVVSANGIVLATNALFETFNDMLRPAAFGRLSAWDRSVERLLQAALPGANQEFAPQVRSFPMRNKEEDRAFVVHVVPLHRSASDIFERGMALVAISGYAADGNIPSDAVLRGLFDLSAAEAGIAADVAAGKSLREAAEGRHIGMATARTHLAQIFRKTGTHQQSELVALLKGSQTLAP